jgi:hypothetical protein
VHRWRYAKTLQALGSTHVHSKKQGIGLCGDWCLGHRVEDASSPVWNWPSLSFKSECIAADLRPHPRANCTPALWWPHWASYLDAHAHQGEWWVRMEDIDGPRCVPGADQTILQQLQQCGLQWDGEIAYQSQRNHLYQRALDQLLAQGLVYLRLHTQRN